VNLRPHFSDIFIFMIYLIFIYFCRKSTSVRMLAPPRPAIIETFLCLLIQLKNYVVLNLKNIIIIFHIQKNKGFMKVL